MKIKLLIILIILFLNSCSTMDVINVGAGVYGGIEKDGN